MLIQLQIFDSIIGFWAHIIEKIWGSVSIYFPLQNNGAAFLRRLLNRHAFLDLDLDKVRSFINLSHSYFMINLHNSLI